VHVDVAIQDVVLRILMGTVDALLREQHGHLRTGQTAHVGVEVDGPAHLVLDGIEGRSDLLAGDGDPGDALGRPLDEAVEVGLPGRSDDHDVVGPVPGRHAHATQIVLEAAGRDLGGDDEVALRVDVAEGVGRGERYGVLEWRRSVVQDEAGRASS
jgi:hypothetical protein